MFQAMKKILYTLIAVGVASFAIVSCNKSENDAPNQEPTIHLQVTAGLDTKTAIVDPGTGKAYGVQWTAGDKLGVFEVADGTIQNKQISDALDSDGTTKTFDFTLNAVSATEYGYTFVYPADALSKGGTSEAPIYRFSIADKQTFPANSFDKKADVLVSEHKTVSAQPSSLTLNFARIGATARMVLTGISSTEIIKMVSFSTTEGNIAGYMKFDPKTGVIDGAKDGVYSGQKTIELTPEATDLALNGDVVVWFRLYDITLTNDFTVYVKTDAAEYTKGVDLATAGKSLEFKNGSLTKFSVDLSTGTTRIDNTTGKTYDLVSSLSDLSEGATYLIVGRYATNTMSGARFDAMGVQNDKVRSSVTIISESDGVGKTDIPASIVVPSAKAVNPVEIGKVGGNYYIKDVYSSSPNDGQYLTATGSNQLVNSDNTDNALSQWTITFNSSIPTIKNVDNDRVISPNLNSNRFAAYTAVQGSNTLLLYVDPDTVVPDTRTEVTLSFYPTSYTLSLGTTEYNEFAGLLVNTTPTGVTGIKYALTGDPIGTVGATTGIFEGNGTAGTATITASFDGDATYKPAASVSYTITVIDPSVIDYVTLDWTYPTSGDATSAGISAIDGVTVDGLGTDYGDSNSPYRIKLDSDGDYIQVKTDSAIDEVSISYKMVGGSNTSTITISESSDGISWSDVEDLSIAGAQNSTGVLKTLSAFDSASRYVKMTFTKGSNVGIGGITITKADPTPRFTVDSPLEATKEADDYVVSVHRKNFTDNIMVSTPTTCDWVFAGDVAAGESTFNVHVNANTGAARSVTLTLSGTGVESRELVINQAGNDPGTEANPYTVAQAIDVAGALANNATTANDVYVSGVVSTVETYFTSYKSISYYISADGTTTSQLLVYSGKGLNGADFSDIADLAIGDQVVVKGKLKNYNSTLEFNTSSQIVVFNPTTRYTVTLGSVTNGSISASATSVGAQSVVTLTATPDSGYEFDKWTVTKDGTSEEITVNTSNQFIMPASNVSVSATFKVSSSPTSTFTLSGNFTANGDDYSLTQNGITVTQRKGTGNAINSSYTSATNLRVYTNNTLEFSGKTIVKIEFTNTASYAGGTGTTVNTGTWTRQANCVWEGESDNIVISNIRGSSDTSNIQFRPTAIKITYKN